MKAWEAKKGESIKAYRAFCVYRDLGPDRSIAKALQISDGAGTAKERRWEGWSARFDWVARARAYDLHQEHEQRKANERAKREMVNRHARLAVLAQNKLIETLKNLDPAAIKPGDLPKWLETSTKIERLARGEPSDRVGVQTENTTAADLTDEQLLALVAQKQAGSD